MKLESFLKDSSAWGGKYHALLACQYETSVTSEESTLLPKSAGLFIINPQKKETKIV